LTPFEKGLREALNRKDPEPDFSRRVMERIARDSTGRLARFPGRRGWVAAGIAAALLLSAAGVEIRHIQRGREAKAQVMVALRIASLKLNLAQRKVIERSGPQHTEEQP
jgi:hypothetical protein